MQYFDILHTQKKMKSSTLWSTYSMLNSIHQRNYGECLQNFPRITQQLKSYNSSYSRKVASVFETKDINQYRSLEENTPYVLVRKAIIVISICGRLRTSELRDLTFESVVQKGDAFEVNLTRKKTKRGEKGIQVCNSVVSSLSCKQLYYCCVGRTR